MSCHACSCGRPTVRLVCGCCPDTVVVARQQPRLCLHELSFIENKLHNQRQTSENDNKHATVSTVIKSKT